MIKKVSSDKALQAYVVGLALGDGNLSNPNGRATRLRITCDKKYPILYHHISKTLRQLLPDNKISFIDRDTCVDVSCYSNKLENLLGWKSGGGSKYKQEVRIPDWILSNQDFTKECLRGIIQTDGSIFTDRGYKMVNIVSNIPTLAETIVNGIENLGYRPRVYIHNDIKTVKYTIRISRDTQKFITDLDLWKR